MDTQTAGTRSGSDKKDVYAIVTERIIEQLDKGTVPWRKPWTDAGIPKNVMSRRPYRGINTMLLAALGYERNLFLTSKQLKEIGGAILAEERPHMVVYWNFMEKELEHPDGKETKKIQRPFLRYYSVYNIAQCVGIPAELLPEIPVRAPEPLTECEAVVNHMPSCPKIQHKDSAAYYDIRLDTVNMPKDKTFESMPAYYATLFHELVHSTGHHSRLDRQGLAQMAEFGSEPYSLEELVAEIGSCHLQFHTGIFTENLEQSAAYIQNWLQVLRNDRYFIVRAASMAQKATDFILDIQPEVAENADE